MRALALGWLTLATLGCATLPPCPAKGGPAWSELRSAHFRVRTDLEPAAGDELVQELEAARAAILAIGWPNAPDPPGRIDVVAFRSERELTALLPAGALAEWVERSPFPSTLLINGADGLQGFSPVAHEVTHDLAHRFLPFEPPWFSEGVATYFETIVADRKTGEVTVGLATSVRYAPLLRGWKRFSGPVVGSRLVGDGNQGARFENASWLLFHYLVDHHRAELTRYQDVLRQLTPWDRAWAQAFPGLSFDQLDNEIEDCLRRECLRTGTKKVTFAPSKIERRPLRDAEVHAMRAFLWKGTPGAGTNVQAEIEEALAQEPGNVEAIADEIYLTDAPRDTAVSLARRASASDEHSWLAAVALADTAGLRDPGTGPALLRALANAPHEPEVLLRLAELDAAERRWEQALALSDRAIRLGASRNGGLLAVYAEALAHNHQCGEAGFVLDAVSRLAFAQSAATLAAAGVEVRSACVSPTAPPPWPLPPPVGQSMR